MKKTILLILAAAFLAFTMVAGAEEILVDSRIARLTSTYECGCERYYYGVMIGRNGLMTKACSFYCPEHGKPYTSVHFEFGSPEPGVSVCEYDGDFFLKTFDKFKTGYDYEGDIAYVRFPELIGDKTGWYRCLILKGQSNIQNARLAFRENTKDGYRETMLSGVEEVSEKALKTAFTEIETARGLPLLLLDDSGDDAVVGIANAFTNGEDDSGIYIRRVTSVVRNQMYQDDMFKEGDQSCPPRTTIVSRGSSAKITAAAPAEEPQAAEEPAAAVEPKASITPVTPGDPSMADEPSDDEAAPVEETAAEPVEEQAEESVEESAAEPVAEAAEEPAPETVEEPAAETSAEDNGAWTCPECGREGNTENFCPVCGAKKPEVLNVWTCPNCGREGNDDNFCPHCGEKRPESGT